MVKAYISEVTSNEDNAMNAALLLEEMAKRASIGNVLQSAIDRTRKTSVHVAFTMADDSDELVTVEYWIPVQSFLSGCDVTPDQVLELLATPSGASRSVRRDQRTDDGDCFVLVQNYYSRDLRRVMNGVAPFLASQQEKVVGATKDESFNKRVMKFIQTLFTDEHAAAAFLKEHSAAE